jgi:CubicO group peptidase (beta-lactamase class C family)
VTTREARRGQWRRWLRRFAVGVVALVLMVGAVYGWAWASVDRSSIARAMWWTGADVGDQFRFPARTIPAGDEIDPLPAGPEIDLSSFPMLGGFDRFLRETGTLAFVVVDDDRLVYERYFGSADRHTRQTSFSVAKSFLSTLVGIATYYGTNLRELALEDTEIEGPPSSEWHYNNYNPLLLGMVLERATGMSISEYMATRLWKPLGAEVDATWSLDSEASGFEKMESGLNAAPVDYARFGQLFLHGGERNGTRIVSPDWVRAATATDASTDPADDYQYFWWIDLERPGRFYALGNLGQYVYVAPDAGAVIVRNGRDWGVDNDTWVGVMRDLADRLVEEP